MRIRAHRPIAATSRTLQRLVKEDLMDSEECFLTQYRMKIMTSELNRRGFITASAAAVAGATVPSLHLHGKTSMANLAFSKAPPGSITVEIALPLNEASEEAKEVSISFFDPVTGVGPIDSVARRQSPGLWKAGPNTLPTPGPWEITLTVLISDFEQEKLSGTWPEFKRTDTK